MSRWRLAALPVLALAASALLWCSTTPAADPVASDAQADSAPRDAARDRNLQPPDAGDELDAPPPAQEPGWRWFAPGGPTCGAYSFAEDPVREAPKLQWTACGRTPYANTLAACSEWDPNSYSEPGAGSSSTVLGGTGGPYFALARSIERTATLFRADRIFYQRDTLKPLAVMREKFAIRPGELQNCQIEPALRGLGEPILFRFTPQFAYLTGAPQALVSASAFKQFAPAYLPLQDIGNDLISSATSLAFSSFAGIVRVNLSDSSWVRASRFVDAPLLIGDDILAKERTADNWRALAHVAPDGVVTTLRAPPNRRLLGAHYDGTYVYWTERFGNADPEALQPHLELWRAPFNRNVAAFNASAELVVRIEGAFGFGTSEFHDGVYVFNGYLNTYAIRVSDARVKVFAEQPDVERVYPTYVDRNAFWYRAEFANPFELRHGKIQFNW